MIKEYPHSFNDFLLKSTYIMKQSYQQKYHKNYEESWSDCTFSGYVLYRFFSTFINREAGTVIGMDSYVYETLSPSRKFKWDMTRFGV